MEKSEVQVLGEEVPENFDTIEEFWAFWDTHSTADYEDLLEPVEIEVGLEGDAMYYPIAKDIVLELRRHARQQGVSTQTLINLWLQERLAKTA
ncbi:MAG: hypothetical protein KIT87_24695 [Anaerolineae bacterium]|nr:hypothetical protein [Anaerolineae bacterium]